MMKYNTNDELFKKLEVSNFINTTVISENPYIIGGISEPLFHGGYPPVYPLREGPTITRLIYEPP